MLQAMNMICKSILQNMNFYGQHFTYHIYMGDMYFRNSNLKTCGIIQKIDDFNYLKTN